MEGLPKPSEILVRGTSVSQQPRNFTDYLPEILPKKDRYKALANW